MGPKADVTHAACYIFHLKQFGILKFASNFEYVIREMESIVPNSENIRQGMLGHFNRISCLSQRQRKNKIVQTWNMEIFGLKYKRQKDLTAANHLDNIHGRNHAESTLCR